MRRKVSETRLYRKEMNIGLIIGGSIVIPHLRYAFEVMDELFAEPKT